MTIVTDKEGLAQLVDQGVPHNILATHVQDPDFPGCLTISIPDDHRKHVLKPYSRRTKRRSKDDPKETQA